MGAADKSKPYLLLADEELISLAENDNPRAFAALYDRHSRLAATDPREGACAPGSSR
jgi:hypothetical protein